MKLVLIADTVSAISSVKLVLIADTVPAISFNTASGKMSIETEVKQ